MPGCHLLDTNCFPLQPYVSSIHKIEKKEVLDRKTRVDHTLYIAIILCIILQLKLFIAGISAKTTARTAFKLSQYLYYTPGYCTSYFESPLWHGNAAIKH